MTTSDGDFNVNLKSNNDTVKKQTELSNIKANQSFFFVVGFFSVKLKVCMVASFFRNATFCLDNTFSNPNSSQTYLGMKNKSLARRKKKHTKKDLPFK